MLEFLSLLHVDWADAFKGKLVLITFKMFNNDRKLSLIDFNELPPILIRDKVYRDVPSN